MAYVTKMLLPLLFLSILSSFVSSEAPHIIVIVADDLGYNDVSWHNDVVLTPHLADLASRGIILEPVSYTHLTLPTNREV